MSIVAFLVLVFKISNCPLSGRDYQFEKNYDAIGGFASTIIDKLQTTIKESDAEVSSYIIENIVVFRQKQ